MKFEFKISPFLFDYGSHSLIAPKTDTTAAYPLFRVFNKGTLRRKVADSILNSRFASWSKFSQKNLIIYTIVIITKLFDIANK